MRSIRIAAPLALVLALGASFASSAANAQVSPPPPAPTLPPQAPQAPPPPVSAPPVVSVPESAAAFDLSAHPSFAFEARLGWWLAQEASDLRETLLSPGLAVGYWYKTHFAMDVAYQFGYGRNGTQGLYTENTFHSLSLRAHYLYPLKWASLTAGAGIAGYMETTAFHPDQGANGTLVAFDWGIPVALGVETWANSHLVRFEALGATRGGHFDLLFGVAAGF